MSESYFTPARVVLLTGAGFSKNFGGFLASEMWSLILNQPEISPSNKLRRCLLEDLNYEKVYDKILTSSDYKNAEKNSFTSALEKAYRQLDDAIRFEPIQHRGQTTMMCRSFIERFSGTGKERTFFFTLNQDLLVERFYSSEVLLQTPGTGHPNWFTSRFKAPLGNDDYVVLPDKDRVERERLNFWLKSGGIQNFVYVKLHGSYGWKSRDNVNAMVIGHAKTGSIKREPLLRWYLELFKRVLETPDRTLVVVGYGFMDPHINDVVADAIKNAGLKLHIISPVEPKGFRNLLVPLHGAGRELPPRGSELWQGLSGYHCASVPDLVRPDSTYLTAQGEAFFRALNLA